MIASLLEIFRLEGRPKRLEICYNKLCLTHANSENDIVPPPELHKLTT
jgi:hypothetical protein